MSLISRPKALGRNNQPSPLHLDFTVNQVQDNMDMTNMWDSKYLNLAIRQVQGNMDLANMSDSGHLDLIIQQVQGIWTWQLAKPKVVIILS